MSSLAGDVPAPTGSSSRLPAWAWPLLALPLVAGIGVWTYTTIAAAIRARLEGTLQTLLASDVSALEGWFEAEANVATIMAQDPRVREEVKTLIAVARQTGGDPAALKAAPAQARLREILTPVVSLQEDAGYFVLDPGGLIVARMLEARIGDRAVFTVADATARALEGKPVFLPPTLKQKFAAVPMAFLMVPIREPDGRASAVMALRILPQRLAAMLSASRLGKTGETYALDADGRMVTESRFSATRPRPWACCLRKRGAAPPPSSRFAIPARYSCRDRPWPRRRRPGR